MFKPKYLNYISLQVMDEGKIAEFDAPYILLQSNNGLFRKLVDRNGTRQASKLKSSLMKIILQKLMILNLMSILNKIQTQIQTQGFSRVFYSFSLGNIEKYNIFIKNIFLFFMFFFLESLIINQNSLIDL